ncbi:MAG: cellulase family glycosylhydrolase [Lentisphaeria bacterium]|nr:cellulase family glycosylhydrolase [Lentisphaeria bacterium]
MKIKMVCLAAILAAGTAAAAAATDDPYGVCAHVSRSELKIAPQEFDRMREAGVNWVRTDFDWNGVEKSRGEWNYAHLDRLTGLAKEEGMNILPILDYDVAWARPAWKNLDAWGEYVRRTVGRYSGTLRYWEVWNEPNHERFWRDKPDGANYVPLLKRAWEEIRKIDPELTVLYGGTAGVPLSYIEKSYAAGAGEYFDVMNIHPYHWQGVPEQMIADFREVRKLMKKYRIDKPIWVTEAGWSTARAPGFFRRVLPAVFRRAGIDPAKSKAALVSDPENGFAGAHFFDPELNLPGFRSVETVSLARLKSIDPAEYRVLVPSLGEEFPAAYINDLVEYVRKGGTLLLPSGLPFYYDIRPDGKKTQLNARLLPRFHIGWDAWWTAEGVPKREAYQRPAPEFAEQFEVEFKPAGRFLHGRNLKPGDEFIPVIEAGTDSWKGATAALYKLNSDLKGNIIVCTAVSAFETVSEARQAELLPRTYLIAMAHGVERIFWYNFRSAEWAPGEREAHFGIVRKDLEPKPSFLALKTLTGLCPSGSTTPSIRRAGDVFLSGWTRPDGVKVWALWSSLREHSVRLGVSGTVAEARNHLGERLPVPDARCSVSPSVTYLVGPEDISFEAPDQE